MGVFWFATTAAVSFSGAGSVVFVARVGAVEIFVELFWPL